MYAVIVDASNDSRELIELASDLYMCGFENVIIFSHLSERDFFFVQISLFETGVPAVVLRCNKGENTKDLLKSVRGSLTGSFLVVYSPHVDGCDLEKSRAIHRKSGKGATLLLSSTQLCGAYFEIEIFDYLEITSNLEKEAIVRIFADDECGIYHLSSYEMR